MSFTLPGVAASDIGDGLRPGETTVETPDTFDAGVWFIGTIRTPWVHRADCPKRGDRDAGPVCRIEIDPLWADALLDVDRRTHLQVLYWMSEARRDVAVQTPRRGGDAPPTQTGTFAIRSPLRPNPIAVSTVRLIEVDGPVLSVRGLDCLDGTPLIDLKPERCLD